MLVPSSLPWKNVVLPCASTQYCSQRLNSGLYLLKLLPSPPAPPVQFSSTTQSPRIRSILLVPAFVPCGLYTSHSPSQKSNCRYSGCLSGNLHGAAFTFICAIAAWYRGLLRSFSNAVSCSNK